MAEKSGSDPMRDNELLTKLIADGAESATTLRGYIGPSTSKDYVRFYPRLGHLSESIEIAREDIIHSIVEPKSVYGSVILWVRKEAKIAFRNVPRPVTDAQQKVDVVELRRGRLRMRLRARDASLARDTCVSVCSCEMCECLCLVLPPYPPPE
jgi:hypothetical protein